MSGESSPTLQNLRFDSPQQQGIGKRGLTFEKICLLVSIAEDECFHETVLKLLKRSGLEGVWHVYKTKSENGTVESKRLWEECKETTQLSLHELISEFFDFVEIRLNFLNVRAIVRLFVETLDFSDIWICREFMSNFLRRDCFAIDGIVYMKIWVKDDVSVYEEKPSKAVNVYIYEYFQHMVLFSSHFFRAYLQDVLSCGPEFQFLIDTLPFHRGPFYAPHTTYYMNPRTVQGTKSRFVHHDGSKCFFIDADEFRILQYGGQL